MKYEHGGDIYGNPGVFLDFSVNVNPLGMPEFVRAAVCESVAECSHYPDSRCAKLRAASSSCYQVPEDCIIFGNGAAELIYEIVRAVRPARAVVIAPSFLEYASALKSIGAAVDFFYLDKKDGFCFDVRRYLDFLLRREPDMIFLCSPSNPIGSVIEREEICEILNFCEAHKIFAVVDECFLEFLESPDKRSCLSHVFSNRASGGLFVMQAPTKTFAMAGLRLGYGFAGKEVIDLLESRRQPWSVSIPAQAAGTAALGAEREEFLHRTRKAVAEGKAVLFSALVKAGFTVYGSEANFLFFEDKSGRPEGALYRYFLERGILIRSCANYEGLNGNFYRICVGAQKNNQKFLENLHGYL